METIKVINLKLGMRKQFLQCQGKLISWVAHFLTLKASSCVLTGKEIPHSKGNSYSLGSLHWI